MDSNDPSTTTEQKETANHIQEWKQFFFLMLAEMLILVIVGLGFHGIERSLTFAATYFWLYFLPGLPLYRVDCDGMTKMIIINMTGIMATSTLLTLMSVIITPRSKTAIMILPLMIFLVHGIIALRYYRKISHE